MSLLGKSTADTDLAEKGLLGALLRWNEAIGDVLQVLRHDDFRTDSHQKIFLAIAGLYDAGKPADTVMVANALHDRGQVADVGYPYLAELWDGEPTGAKAVYYAGVVRDASICRRLAVAGNEIVRDSTERKDAAEQLLEGAERRIFEIAQLGLTGQTVSLSDAVNLACDRMDARSSGQRRSGLGTGYRDIDNVTGGLQDGELTVIAARPSCGKTALAACLARNAVGAGEAALFASLEQSHVELAERILCREAKVDLLRLRQGWLGPEEMSRVDAARQHLAGMRLFIDDAPHQTMLRIGANARRLKLKHGIRLIVVDYLQMVDPEDRKAPRQEQVASISRRLKQLAREIDVPVVALAQLNRSSEDRLDRRPRLSDLRESGAIEADADGVWLLHRPEQNGDVVELIVAKQRNGPTGDLKLYFRKEQMAFEDYAEEHVPSFSVG